MSPESAYAHGLFFADGSIYTRTYRLSLEMKSEDLDDLIPILMSLTDWNVYRRQRTRKQSLCQPITMLYKGNKTLCNSLCETGYYKPKDAQLAIDNIPPRLQFMWFRGFFDGDGCYYHHPKQYLYQISIAGDHDYDWSFLPDFGFKIQNGKTGSHARLTSKSRCVAWMSYLYPNGYDGIGLERKWSKYHNTIY